MTKKKNTPGFEAPRQEQLKRAQKSRNARNTPKKQQQVEDDKILEVVLRVMREDKAVLKKLAG